MTIQADGVMNLAPNYFQQILSGEKTVEGRIAKEKLRALQIGQTLLFVSEGKQVLTNIIDIRHFPSFKDYLQYYGLKHCLPGVDSIEAGIEVYHSFPGYKTNESLLGVIGIQIQLIDHLDERVI